MVISSAAHGRSALLHGRYNILIAGTPAEIPLELRANRLGRRVRVTSDEIQRAHDHARCTETTLQPVTLFERDLHGMHRPIAVRETFDRDHLAVLHLGEKDHA